MTIDSLAILHLNAEKNLEYIMSATQAVVNAGGDASTAATAGSADVNTCVV